jgi:prepilin-type N-terminal cleavage/methylation domain-containing protein
MIRPARDRAAGFSLLEVMVSVAILGLSLVLIVEMVTNNVRATHHARNVTTATFLARTKIAALEDDILHVGFSDTDQEDSGSFADEGFPSFSWTTLIEAVELPADIAQKTQQASTDQQQQSNNPMMMMAGFLGGMMSTIIEPIRQGLEQAVRRVTVHVVWNEPSRPEQVVDVVAYFTDPAKLDLALGTGAATAGGGPPAGTGGAPGGGGTGGAPGGRR